MEKKQSRQLSARLVKIGTCTHWDPEKSVTDLSNDFIRQAFKHDSTKNGEDVESLLRDLKRNVMMAPEEVREESYIVNNWGLAFPVVSNHPVIFRKGKGASLATLTLFTIHTPTGSRDMQCLMPHIICVRPQNEWWSTIKETILEILRQHFTVPENALEELHVRRMKSDQTISETMMKLSMPFPLSLKYRAKGQETTLKTLR